MRNVFRYLKSYSEQPIRVDRLIVSAFLQINNLNPLHNRILLNYLIVADEIKERESLNQFIEVINNEIETFTIEKLIELFEFVISPSERIINGAIYTPSDIREYIISQSLSSEHVELNTVKIADIACGCAGFLYSAAKEL